MSREEENIINMAEARKRQQTLAKQEKAKKKQATRSGEPVKDLKWWISGVIQMAVFLFLVYWLMESCGG